MAPLPPHPRRFILHVTAVDIEMRGDDPQDDRDLDSVEIVFHGRVRKSSLERIVRSLEARAYTTEEKRLA